MKLRQIKITDIVIPPERPRALQPAAVKGLVDSIKEIGLRTPITVRMRDDKPHLVTGEHRIAAMRDLGCEFIEATVFDNEDNARIWAIDENLQRADLNAIERSQHMAARAALIERRLAAAREPERRLATRAEAKAAGEIFYYPPEPCAHGHAGKRFVSNGECQECHKAKTARWRQSKGPSKMGNGSPFRPGRGNTGGDRATARELGVDNHTVRTAKIISKLSKRAQQVAIELGIANKHHALKYAASHDTAELQVRALHHAKRIMGEKAERKRREQLTVQEQAALEPVAPRQMGLRNLAREATVTYWLWLLEEFGDRAYAIVNRLREVDLPLLLKEADRAKAEGNIARKASLH